MTAAEFMNERPSISERRAALRIGASVLRSWWPIVQADCIVVIGPNSLNAHVSMEWPGVIRVTLRHTGELVAQSMPGQPFEIDTSVLA